ncbi:MAG: DUF2905 domain-containing protein [Gloeomargarita sp. SKYBB_i_bin120]|nr:DUF2905 domain-containing protein [Gloeomargarita sp. SKYG98]MCS7291431.1 DUF2905 domain-containing protein [Gloeomargarita sp. SKYB120]MDW8176991.1 DUF2905 domain-containing protein [Gloeomargarita sp. SKYBB_i_bin120]
MTEIGKLLMITGAVLFLIGFMLAFSARFPWFGRLPGDIVINNGNFTFIAPLGTMLLLSLVLTVLLNVVVRLWR